MGTNYYLFTKNKKIMQDNFNEFALTDSPEFGYERHICKLSYGCKPILQGAECFKTFKELFDLCEKTHEFLVLDEYGIQYNFDKFEDLLVNHANQERYPLKWIKKENEFDPQRRMIITTVECDKEEAELYTPIDHLEYQKTENDARKKYHVCDFDWVRTINYWRDPDYPFDWTEGEFS